MWRVRSGCEGGGGVVRPVTLWVTTQRGCRLWTAISFRHACICYHLHCAARHVFRHGESLYNVASEQFTRPSLSGVQQGVLTRFMYHQRFHTTSVRCA